MHFNTDELAIFAESAGDQEGRLTHKPPPRTLYDSAYKERWFKLKANLLFYYRLNEFGGVEKNEPSGVFVLENIEVQREEISDAPFGFAIRWKDDMERKHLFFAQSEASAFAWVTKLIHASYEHMRAQILMLRVQIRRKTGKDPLEHLGTPLVQRTARVISQRKSQFHVNLEEDQLSQESQKGHVLESRLLVHKNPERLSPTRYSLPLKSPNLKIKVFKSSSLKEPVRTAPVPPPRKGKKQNAGNGHVIVDDLVPGVGCSRASFQCHIKGSRCACAFAVPS